MKTDEHEEMRSLLKQYLGQYYRKRKRKKILQCRLDNFHTEMLGTRDVNYSSMPKNRTNDITDEQAEFCIKLEEIEAKTLAEKKAASSAMLKVIDMIELLPEDSYEKNILELRYVDNLSWGEIAKAQSMSKSRCIDYWNIGLDKLLGLNEVRAILSEYSTGERLIS